MTDVRMRRESAIALVMIVAGVGGAIGSAIRGDGALIPLGLSALALSGLLKYVRLRTS
ncbi:hypothetical protein [Streptomyces sp. NBC_01304]|uniref:hypothetical protein n=1 Tax=Streptomyces sp. NBC_01304 TaxID=2903818 RepID=UPI002E11B4AF|nr:hypothetical protein OG430_41985 [Streptomyces sp. NBC_01304]